MFTHKLGDTLFFSFTTVNSDAQLANADSTPTFTVYRNGTAVGALTAVSATNVTTGVYRGSAAITSGNGFASGDHVIVVSTAVVSTLSYGAIIAERVVSTRGIDDNVTVGGYAAGQVPLQPTVAGRTLDVTATGAAGIDWANVEGQASSVNLTNTDVANVQQNVQGNVSGSVASVTNLGALATAAIRTELATELGQIGAILDDTGTTGVKLDASTDVYPADIQFTADGDNAQDEYTVTWFRNGAAVTSGITSPTIRVVKRSDGTDLIASTSLTQIGTTGSYKYDEDTDRIGEGEAAIVIVSATINGGTRSWRKLVSRDKA